MAWAWDETGDGRVRCGHDNSGIGLVEAALSSCRALSAKQLVPLDLHSASIRGERACCDNTLPCTGTLGIGLELLSLNR